MLQSLHVKNLALIDECEVEFGEGLNILSGETGAGKSIIIGSINLALGGKVSKEMLREDADSALTELLFVVEDPDLVASLTARDIPMEDDSLLISRRIKDGRSVFRMNGETVTAALVKEAASQLLDIHGQHDGQALLHKKHHLELLDDFGGAKLSDKKKEVRAAFLAYKKSQKALEEASLDESGRARELSFLEYEIKEISEAELTVGEDEELEKDYRRFVNGQKIREGAFAAYDLAAGGRENASDLISRALREISSVSAYDEELGQLEEELSQLDSLLSDFDHELSAYLSGLDFDEEAFSRMEKRLDQINGLKAKYGRTIPDILKSLKEKEERAAVLADYDIYLDKLKKEVLAREKELKKLCGQLTDLRKKAASDMLPQVRQALTDLNFLDVRMEMAFSPLSDYTANGLEEGEFMISTNPGEPLRPLDKIASGGELSRIMLGIKAVMADRDRIPTLIFDEIDTGISGRTAQKVAEKMHFLGQSHQLLCITHLPQLAAMADCHFLIEKGTDGGRTRTAIRRLDSESSVMELARMLGGVSITDKVIESAREMKALAGTS